MDAHGGSASDDFHVELTAALAAPLIGTFCTDLRSMPCDAPPELVARGVPPHPSGAALTVLGTADVGDTLRALRQAGRAGLGQVDVRTADGLAVRVTVFDQREESGVHVWLVAPIGPDVPTDRSGMPRGVRSFGARRNPLAEFLSVDDEITELLGWHADEVVGRTALDFLHPGDVERSIDAWVDVLERSAISHNRCRWRCKDGSWRWVEVFNELIDDETIASRVVDVQAEMDALAEARLGQEGFATLTEALPIGVAQVDPEGRLVYANDALIELNERLNDGADLSDFAAVCRNDPQIDAAMSAALDGEAADCLVTFEIGADIHAIQVRARPLTVDGEAAGAMATFDDVSDAKALERELHVRATIDPLTQLANRASVLDHLDAIVAADDPSIDHSALLYIDLDHFKHVNDSMGHAAGDDLLAEIAERLRASVRLGDFVGRLGGDEFLVICSSVTDEAEACRLAERIQQAMAQPFAIGGRAIHTSLSIGVALTEPGRSASELLAAADAAAYEAKAKGRNAVHVFDQAMRHRSAERLELTTELQFSLGRPGEICAYFQPVVDLATGAITAFEALARWHHPTRGLLPAGAFVEVAEDVGLEVPVGWQVFEDAASFARECADLRVGDEPTTINVNVSARQLSEPGLVQRVAEVIERAGAHPNQICIEVTERTLVSDIESASATLAALRRLGIRTAIDDFGTGHSSLSYLRTLPFDTIKIDMSFTQTLLEGNDSMAIVGGIIRMCQAMDRQVIAEGIESHEQAAALHGLRCPLGQGYLFAPALEPTDALDLLRSGRTTRTGVGS